MCALDMDEKGNLYLYKFALLCKTEIIKRLISGSYHLAESGDDRPNTIGNSLIRLFSWYEVIIVWLFPWVIWGKP